jgi:hypothetical protein
MSYFQLGTFKMSVGRLRKKLNPDSGPVVSALATWARIYRAFVLARFDKFSVGGGDWKKLSPGTIAGKKSSAILVDTRLMRLGLGSGIGIVKRYGKSVLHVTMGFTNRSKHPGTDLTIADLASIHHLGRGVPKRSILVGPDKATAQKMGQVIVDVLKKR